MDDLDTNPYQSSSPNIARQTGQKSGSPVAAIMVAAIANIGAVGITLTLASTPSGTAIRPLGTTMVVALFSALGLFVGVPLSVSAIWRVRSGNRVLAFLTLIFCLTPFLFSGITLSLVANWCGFTLKD
jgi:hypothetical protein